MKEQKKQPELRFKGFTDDWEERKFGELYKKNLERNKDHFSSDRTISIATMRFKKEGNGAAENSLVSYKVLREGDIAFEGHTSKRFAFGRFVLNDIGDGIMSPRFTTLRPTQNMPIKFWKQYIHYEPIMRYPIVNSTKLGTMMNELVVDEFLNQPVLVPELSEQEKIGSFFQQLDETIALHQRKLDLLKKLKQGYLQQMFPAKDEVIPQLRFSDFYENWKLQKLGDIAKSFSGGTPSVGNKEYYNGKIPFIRSAEINKKETELFLTENGLANSSAKLVSQGTILYALYGATSGEVGISHINGAINQAILAIMPSDGYSTLFIVQWLRNNKKKITDKYIQGGQGNLSGAIIKDLQIEFPSKKEQKLVGEFFNKLDQNIALQHSKIGQLNKLKQAYLQKLFP